MREPIKSWRTKPKEGKSWWIKLYVQKTNWTFGFWWARKPGRRWTLWIGLEFGPVQLLAQQHYIGRRNR